jgi:hypothetical protein
VKKVPLAKLPNCTNAILTSNRHLKIR